jgi:hypothetical protein
VPWPTPYFPWFGLVPWFAFLLRQRSRRLFAFLDDAMQITSLKSMQSRIPRYLDRAVRVA